MYKVQSMRIFRSIAALVFSIIAVTLSGCEQQTFDKLTLTGSSTLAPLVMELGQAFEKRNPGTRIDVQTGGSSRGIADTRAGLASIGMVSRSLKSSENDLFSHTIAFDGITPIINKANPIKALNDQQIIAIYTGKIKNWQAVGGPDQAITVVNKAEGRSTLELFLKHFQLDNRDITADVIIGDNQQGIKTIAGNPWAIGYVSIGSAEYEERRGSPIKLLGIGGVKASTTAVKQGNYPLSRSLNLVTLGTPQGLTQSFIEFTQSPQAAAIVEQHYFIPIDAN